MFFSTTFFIRHHQLLAESLSGAQWEGTWKSRFNLVFKMIAENYLKIILMCFTSTRFIFSSTDAFCIQLFIAALYIVQDCYFNWTRISKNFKYCILESTFPRIHISSMQNQKYLLKNMSPCFIVQMYYKIYSQETSGLYSHQFGLNTYVNR